MSNALSVQSAFGDPETKYFYQLTPEIILSAVETFGFTCTGHCMALNSMENRVYQLGVEVENERLGRNASERFRIVKFYRPGRWTKEQILEEHRFLLELADYDIPVVAPMLFENGETLLQAPEINIWFAVFPRIGGRNPSELTDEQIPQIGRLLARLHNVGATSEAPGRIKIDPTSYGLDNLRFLLESKTIPPHYESRYREIAETVCEISAPWFEDAEVQRIHGDSHLGNLLWGEDGPFWVDFDDMLRGPCVQDLWLVLPSREQQQGQQFKLLLEAYAQMRDFDRRTLRLIEPLRTLRIIHFNSWIARRWSDPAFPRAFVEFGSERYWNEQVAQLEEQLELVKRRDLITQKP